MTTWNRVAGDISDTLTVTINGIADLTEVTAVEAHVWTDTISAVTLTAAVADATARTVTVQLGTWLQNTAVGGLRYNLEYELTFTGGTQRTWPENGTDFILVRAQGA